MEDNIIFAFKGFNIIYKKNESITKKNHRNIKVPIFVNNF